MKKETLLLLLLLGAGGLYLYMNRNKGLVSVTSPEKITEDEFNNPGADPRTQLDLLMDPNNTGRMAPIDPGYLFSGNATVSDVLSEPLFPPDPVKDNANLDLYADAPGGGGGGYIEPYYSEQIYNEKMNYLQAASIEDMRISGTGKRKKEIGNFV